MLWISRVYMCPAYDRWAQGGSQCLRQGWIRQEENAQVVWPQLEVFTAHWLSERPYTAESRDSLSYWSRNRLSCWSRDSLSWWQLGKAQA